MPDDDLDPKEELDGEEVEDDFDDPLNPGKKKPKKVAEDDSLDELADEEETALPEDSFDDVDLW